MYPLILTIVLLFGVMSSHAQVRPSGGTTEVPITPGSTVDIVWSHDLVSGAVDLELWDGERARSVPIAARIAARDRRYTWTLPTDIQPGAMYRFVVRDHDRPHVALFSPSFVRIGAERPVISDVRMMADDERIDVGPMPATDELRVRWPAGLYTDVAIVDLHGGVRVQRVLYGASSTLSIDVRTLPSGAYSIVFGRPDGSRVARPIVIQR